MCCPGCKKEHLITLSVCPSCGTMVGDSVREELAEKIIITTSQKFISKRSDTFAVQKPSSQIKLNPPPSPIITEQEIKSATSEIASKKTNRTLVEFQSKDGTVPEWRTQLKNAVRQRMIQKSPDSVGTSTGAATAVALETPQVEDDFFDSADIIEESKPESKDISVLSEALKRIETSRDKYYINETETLREIEKPFGVRAVEKSNKNNAESIEETVSEKASVNFPVKPTYTTDVNLYDTSELDPEFEPAKVSSSFGKVAIRTSAKADADEVVDTPLVTKKQIDPEATAKKAKEIEKTVAYEDDQAPFAYRFNAGLFDLLITSFASMVLLAPFMLLGGNWFTVSGLFAFLATCSIVTFIYLTTTIGLFGKSFGMHLFAIEMIDGEGEEYPTLHQAAVSSSVFLLSLALGGVGFLTCCFDEDRRAIQDIVSNTLVVREL